MKDGNGDKLKSASVVVEFTLQDGTTQQASGTTNSKGKVTFEWKGLDKSDFDVEVTVLSVTKDGDSYSPPSKTCTLEKD